MSKEISLPLVWQVRLFGPFLLLLSTILVGFTPLASAAKIGLTGALLVFGGWQWRRSLHQQARYVALGKSGIEHLDLADGRRIQVHRVLPGVVRPWLLSASVFDQAGRRADLFVPGNVLTAFQHWQLRRAVLAFQSPQDK